MEILFLEYGAPPETASCLNIRNFLKQSSLKEWFINSELEVVLLDFYSVTKAALVFFKQNSILFAFSKEQTDR